MSTSGLMPLPVPHWGLALGGLCLLPFSITRRAFSCGLEEGPPQGGGSASLGEGR